MELGGKGEGRDEQVGGQGRSRVTPATPKEYRPVPSEREPRFATATCPDVGIGRSAGRECFREMAATATTAGRDELDCAQAR